MSTSALAAKTSASASADPRPRAPDSKHKTKNDPCSTRVVVLAHRTGAAASDEIRCPGGCTPKVVHPRAGIQIVVGLTDLPVPPGGLLDEQRRVGGGSRDVLPRRVHPIHLRLDWYRARTASSSPGKGTWCTLAWLLRSDRAQGRWSQRERTMTDRCLCNSPSSASHGRSGRT